jgi:hypothetical protein
MSNDKSRNLRLRNPLTLEARKMMAEKLFRDGLNAKTVQSEIRNQFGVGLGRADLNWTETMVKLSSIKTANAQKELDLRPPGAEAVLELIPDRAAISVVKHMMEKGFRCFVHPDGKLELRR